MQRVVRYHTYHARTTKTVTCKKNSTNTKSVPFRLCLIIQRRGIEVNSYVKDVSSSAGIRKKVILILLFSATASTHSYRNWRSAPPPSASSTSNPQRRCTLSERPAAACCAASRRRCNTAGLAEEKKRQAERGREEGVKTSAEQ